MLVISEELDELFEICDRIAVLARGRLSPARPARESDAETVGQMMGGSFIAADASFGSAPATVAMPRFLDAP